MAVSIDVKLENNQWLDINTATGIAVGEPMVITNKNPNPCLKQEGDLEPATLLEGDPLTNTGSPYAETEIAAGSDRVWIRCLSTTGTVLTVKQQSLGVSDPAFMTNTDGKNLPTSAIGFADNVAFVDAFGQLVCDKMVSSISANFADGRLDEQFDVMPPALTGDGAATAVNGYAQVSSAATGTAIIESRDSIRYSNGRGYYILMTASFEGSGTGYAGGFDGSTFHDGFALRYDGATDVLEFGYFDAGVFTDQIEIDHAGLGLELSNLNIFAIIGGFLGVANPTLLVKKDTWKVAGVIKTEGRIDECHVRIPAFPISIRAENDMIVKTGSIHGGTIGSAEKVQDRGFSYPNQVFTNTGDAGNPPTAVRGRLTLSGTDIATAFILRSKDLYNGLPNKVKTDVINVSLTVEPSADNGVVQAMLVGNPTNISPSAVYSDVSPSSVIEIDDNAGGQATGLYVSGSSTGDVVGEPINIVYAGSGATRLGGEGETIVDELSLDGIAGETLAFLIRDLGGNGVVVDWRITWIERQI